MAKKQPDVVAVEDTKADRIAALKAEIADLEAPAKVEYPKWLYAKGKRSQLVASAEDADALGAGWYESPEGL